MFKKFPSERISSAKNSLSFHLRASAHHSFIFNLRFLYDLKHKARLSKSVCGIFSFRLRFIFIKVYICLSKKYELFDFRSS